MDQTLNNFLSGKLIKSVTFTAMTVSSVGAVVCLWWAAYNALQTVFAYSLANALTLQDSASIIATHGLSALSADAQLFGGVGAGLLLGRLVLGAVHRSIYKKRCKDCLLAVYATVTCVILLTASVLGMSAAIVKQFPGLA